MPGLACAEARSEVGHAAGELVHHPRRHFLRGMGGSVCDRVRRQSLSTCYAVAILVCLIKIVWYPCYEHTCFVGSLELSTRTKQHNCALIQP